MKREKEESNPPVSPTENTPGKDLAYPSAVISPSKHLAPSPASSGASPTDKQKRKRNKPSLSCEACTSKKTKCDRDRPRCLACITRKSDCRYSNLILPTKAVKRSSQTKTCKDTHHVKDIQQDVLQSLSVPTYSPMIPEPLSQWTSLRKTPSRSAQQGDITLCKPPLEAPGNYSTMKSSPAGISSPILLSNPPTSALHQTFVSVFKVEHPFSNYWTQKGGLPEVIGVLPSKEQASILVATYFEVVDPVYPLLHREAFAHEYENFWSLPADERKRADGSLIALIFAMLALGQQFFSMPSAQQKQQSAEFYISATHQALRVINYLAQPSIRSLQTMVLMIYYLMNDNHASDAWAFAGILCRHACSLGLNREPANLLPHASILEQQQRRRLWQAILFQDTFFTIILKFPPSTTHSDCKVENLLLNNHDAASEPDIDGATDTTYVASMWKLANLVQPTLCTPRALDLPISRDAQARTCLVTLFEELYSSLPGPFRSCNDSALCDLASQSRRLARQILFLNSNYHHCLMLVHSEGHDEMPLDVDGTLDSAHDAISTFFLLHKLFQSEARVWYHFQHRAYSEALVIAELLRNGGDDLLATDPRRMRAKADIFKMIGILNQTSGHDIVSQKRVTVLQEYI